MATGVLLSCPQFNHLFLLFHLISNPTLHIEMLHLRQPLLHHLHTRMALALHNLTLTVKHHNP